MQPIPREKIPWFPRIDYEKCRGCRTCFDFCKNRVYEWENGEPPHPKVTNPYNCVLGCSACAQLCPVGAISFPTVEEMRKTMRELRSGKSEE
jgi:NAD-dependent dihydropyrimidine dehydrogenase PreA subunit